MGNNETTPKTGMVLQVEATDISFPTHISDCFSLVLHLARVSVTTGSMRRHLDPTEGAQAVHLLQYVPLPEGLRCLAAQSQEHEGDSRRRSVTVGEPDRAVEGP